jgi:hypothetical protein
MRRRDLRDYGLEGYVRTDAPGECFDAFVRRFGYEPCPQRTFEHRHAHGLRQLLPFDYIDDVMPDHLARPTDRYGEVLEIRITRQESTFPVVIAFPTMIQTSKEAQAAIMRAGRAAKRAIVTDPSCPSPMGDVFVVPPSTR